MFKIISKKKYRARIRAYESIIAALSRQMEAKDILIVQQEQVVRNIAEELSRIVASRRTLRKNKLLRDARGRFIKRNQQKQ